MNSVARTIRRERTDPKSLDTREKISCYIELESVLSKGALMASSDEESPGLLKETTALTGDFLGDSDSEGYKMPTGETISKENIDRIITRLLSNLFSDLDISRDDIDVLIPYSDAFGELKSPKETKILVKEIIDSCERELGSSSFRTRFEPPHLAANESKSKMMASGMKRITNSGKGPNSLPQVFLDFSTCLSGIALPPEDSDSIRGIITGTGWGILDALARSHGKVESEKGNTLRMPDDEGEVYESEAREFATRSLDQVDVRRVPSGANRIDGIPVDVEESYDRNIKLISCSVEKNGNDLKEITRIGREAASYGSKTLRKTIDETFARLAGEIVKKIYEEDLINSESGLCISGRGIFTGEKSEKVIEILDKMGFEEVADNTVFAEDLSPFGEASYFS